MKHLKKFENFKSLLEIGDYVDKDLISKIESMVSKGSDILEISCGNGADAKYLIKRGYDVTCTENHEEYCDHVNQFCECILHDTRNKFPFRDGGFDLIYSRLGLHYFKKSELVSIFSEIQRMTDNLVFSVKLSDDSIKSGKIIFSKVEWESIVEDSGFDIISSEVKKGELYGFESKWLEIMASKLNI